MTSRNILDAMGEIAPDMIAEAAPGVVQRKRGNQTWVKWGAAVAACLCLVVAIGVAVSPRIYREYFHTGDQSIVDELYPFDSIRVGESAAFDSVYGGGISGIVTYDTLQDTSFSFTVTVNESNEYAHDLILNHYIEFEVNGEYVADKGERIPVYPLLDVYVNGIQQDGYDKMTDTITFVIKGSCAFGRIDNYDPEGVSGIATECVDPAIKQKMLEECPVLTKHFSSANAPHYNLFQIEITNSEFFS